MALPMLGALRCRRCNGEGEIKVELLYGEDDGSYWCACPDCGGTGREGGRS